MKHKVLITALLLMLSALVLNAQDRELMLRSRFSAPDVEQAADSTTVAERIAGAIGTQLGSRGFYNPPTYLFFRKAVKELGFLRGSLATIDRMLKASKIGTATSKAQAGPDGIAEGPEAYILPKKAQR